MPIGFGLVLVGYSLVYVGVWRLRGDQRTIVNIVKGVGAPVLAPGTGSNSAAAVAQIGQNTAAARAQGLSSPTGQTRGGNKAQPGARGGKP